MVSPGFSSGMLSRTSLPSSVIGGVPAGAESSLALSATRTNPDGSASRSSTSKAGPVNPKSWAVATTV